jgi:hypothetical protein
MKEKQSEALKKWNKQARSIAKPGYCCAINCTCKVPKGTAYCEEHK